MNAGNVQNQGFELSLGWFQDFGNEFTWSTDLNLSYNCLLYTSDMPKQTSFKYLVCSGPDRLWGITVDTGQAHHLPCRA